MGRNQCGFSHLFYVDDLTLMSKIDKNYPRTILYCPNLFCSMSRQKINYSKSKTIVSKNYPNSTTKNYSKLFNVRISNSFEKYLGFPITHTKPKAIDYQFILDNMKNRLASWKTNCLDMACRTTLVSVSLNFIPNHVMQYSLLPTKILKNINKIQSNFIWGSTTTTIKIHLICWNIITFDKKEGGLGVRAAKPKNLVSLANLARRLIKNTQNPWVKILSSLYRSNTSLTNFSFSWKSIINGWGICIKGIKWIPSNNSTLNI